MRAASEAMKVFLASRAPFITADLYTFNLINGSTYRWTTASQNISYGGVVWEAVGPVIDKGTWTTKYTLEVPTLQVDIYSNGSDFNGVNIKTAIHNGLFDGAFIEVQRAIMPTFGDTSLGLITIFAGKTGEVDIGTAKITLTIKGLNQFMTQMFPRNTYSAGCQHTVYDAGCTLNRAQYTETHTIVSANKITLNLDTVLTDQDRWLWGVVQVLTGNSVGERRTIEACDGSSINVGYPFYTAPVAGDTVQITRGCARTRDNCNYFNNIINFRGFPFIPPSSTGL